MKKSSQLFKLTQQNHLNQSLQDQIQPQSQVSKSPPPSIRTETSGITYTQNIQHQQQQQHPQQQHQPQQQLLSVNKHNSRINSILVILLAIQ
jgi:hypothetical protein